MKNRMNLIQFFENAWTRYLKAAPEAEQVVSALRERGESVVNDHVAFRTFDIPGISRKEIGRIFESWGYRMYPEQLDFPDKKLEANYWIHSNRMLPKVFISELLTGRFQPELRAWARDLAAQATLSGRPLKARDLLEPSWQPIRYEDYEKLYPISEYAAWTGAFGIQLNHFTVSVNQLKSFDSLQELNSFLKSKGIVLSAAGGEIKGTPAELLEQSSTLARRVPVRFAGGVTREIMGCYYEFALRYRNPGTHEYFEGFVPKSADRIFESNFEPMTANSNAPGMRNTIRIES